MSVVRTYLQSRVYPYGFASEVRAAGVVVGKSEFQTYFTSAVTASASVASGELNIPIVDYEMLASAAFASTREVESGTLREVTVTYGDWPADVVEAGAREVTEGNMIAPIIEYPYWPADSAAAAARAVVSGTLN